jgi:hypothetical protein
MSPTRRKKLIDPALQLKLVGAFTGLAVLGLLLQFLLMMREMTAAARGIPEVGGMLADVMPGVLVRALAVALVVVVPLLLGVGIALTFRVAGPVYRFEQFLGAVARGEQIEPCRIRKGDYFQSLCAKINDATEPQRRQAAERAEQAEPRERQAA